MSRAPYTGGDDRARELIEGGSELAGAAVGGALGLIGGPPGVVGGAVVGVALTRTLKKVGGEVVERVFGPRQRVRVGAAYSFAAAEIKARLDAGEKLRSDGFLTSDEGRRSSGEEILEGVLLGAADAYEERKVRHLGWFFASLAFDPSVGPADANHLLHLAERLSYRQLCCLSVLAEERPQFPVRDLVSVMGRPIVRSEAVNAELDDLGQAAVIGLVEPEQGRVVRPSSTYGGADFTSIDLTNVRAAPLGETLYRLMRLDQISEADLARVYGELGGDSLLSGTNGH